MVGLMLVAVVVAVAPLLFILGDLLVRGAGSLSFEFFTREPVPAGETGGGVRHAIVGTLLIVGMASLVGIPLGVAAGVYAAEYSTTRLARLSRFVADVMNGTPSIVVGVFAWTLIVARYKQFSAIAGACALAMLMVPMVMRTTEELVKMVPHSLREAALALDPGGAPACRSSSAPPAGIVTGVLVAVARIAGRQRRCFSPRWAASSELPDPRADRRAPLTVYTTPRPYSGTRWRGRPRWS
jgi:phosphate transport system permease protein